MLGSSWASSLVQIAAVIAAITVVIPPKKAVTKEVRLARVTIGLAGVL
ncbi:hypothetical protein Q671_13225 [Halomonas sp. PBN3]|nr:hypothetical protein Q671_13225 [Halomonas sp. PBN3]